jgi:hypothetical protein
MRIQYGSGSETLVPIIERVSAFAGLLGVLAVTGILAIAGVPVFAGVLMYFNKIETCKTIKLKNWQNFKGYGAY